MKRRNLLTAFGTTGLAAALSPLTLRAQASLNAQEDQAKSRAAKALKDQLEQGRISPGAGELTQMPTPARLYRDLEGTIDLHVHTIPDGFPRLMDDIETVAQAKAAKMRAVMLKCHVVPTPDRAYIAQRAVGGGIQVFGLICLNTPVGGMNPEAVRMAIRMGAKAVWMPSMWAENHARYVRESQKSMGYETLGMEFPNPGETILTNDGEMKPAVKEILKLVADHDLQLSTGHLSLKEAHLLVDEASKMGIKKLIVHTVNYHVLHYPLEDQKRMVEKGAFLEFGFSSLPYPIWEPVDPKRRISLDDVVTSMRAVGVEHCIITTDSGQVSSPPPVECMRLWIELLKTKGFKSEEIDCMAKTNPAKLLGLA